MANTREVFIGPTSCLAASLVEFKLFINELYRFGFWFTSRRTKNFCQSQATQIDEVSVQGHAFYYYTLSVSQIFDAEALLAGVTQTVFY